MVYLLTNVALLDVSGLVCGPVQCTHCPLYSNVCKTENRNRITLLFGLFCYLISPPLAAQFNVNATSFNSALQTNNITNKSHVPLCVSHFYT